METVQISINLINQLKRNALKYQSGLKDGSEAYVRPYAKDSRYLMKIYKMEGIQDAKYYFIKNKEQMLLQLEKHAELQPFVNIPEAFLRDEMNVIRGVLIPKISRATVGRDWFLQYANDDAKILTVLKQLSAYLKQIHACPEGFYVNDLSSRNLLIAPKLSAHYIDADSFGMNGIKPGVCAGELTCILGNRIIFENLPAGQNTDRVLFAFMALDIVAKSVVPFCQKKNSIFRMDEETYQGRLEYLSCCGLPDKLVDFFVQLRQDLTTEIGYFEEYEEMFQKVKKYDLSMYLK